jgi:peptidoglycan hydrolase CwlO-like protein
MNWRLKPGFAPARARLAALVSLLVAGALFAATARATDIGALQSRVDAAREQAGVLAADLEEKQRQMVSAQQQAFAAAARERQLSGLLAVGQQRSARLGGEVERGERQLAIERARLRRALIVLSQRLVAIYKAGSPDATELVLGAQGYGDLLMRADYLEMIEDSDSRLAGRVRQVRNEVRFQLAVVERLKARQDAYNARLASARSQISAVRAEAETAAAELAAIRASRAATLSELQGNIDGWVSEIQRAEALSAAQAEQTIGKWLGGPYSIPASIVMCESGGNYGAVNPSSGAGGAYQILPSTWELYGGEGAPQDASKQEQDQIAAQIWSDSGSGAWVCAG